MFSMLLAMGLLASPAQRCDALWAGIAQGKAFKQDLADMLQGDARKIAAMRTHFLEGCRKLPDPDTACGVAHPGRALFRDCPALGRLFHASATAPDVAGSAIAEMREKGLAREALANLRALGQAARLLRLQDGPTPSFRFPVSTGPTPARDCCASEEKVCRSAPAEWSRPTWKALHFAPRGPLRFRYSFESGGRGNGAHFTARAVGDPDCSGSRQIWVVTGASEDGRFVVSDVTAQ